MENGADAIYFGLERFNARMRARNFTVTDLPRLMEFLHRRGVRGYVTFNTLVFADELAEAEDYLRSIITAGVDAAIVQDVGICRLIRRLSPDFPIHTSTQMTVTSAAGVEFARELGAQLVVLARENSLKEIAAIQAAPFAGQAAHPLPLEVFVHGALCVAYSGQCLTSESLGGRSANRGECAQACRMPYELVADGRTVDLGDRRYLQSAGPRRPGRPAGARPRGRRFAEDRGPAQKPRIRRQHHGRLSPRARSRLRRPGDGVVFDAGRPDEKEEGGRVYEVRPAGGESVLRFGRGDIAFARLHVGDRVWKTDDPELDRRLRQSFAGDRIRFRRPLRLEVHGQAGAPLTLIARDAEGHGAAADSAVPLARAESQPLTTARLRDQLGRLGGTPFTLGDLDNRLEGAVILPVSELNELRRRVVAELERQRALPRRWTLQTGESGRFSRLGQPGAAEPTATSSATTTTSSGSRIAAGAATSRSTWRIRSPRNTSSGGTGWSASPRRTT